MTLMFRIFNHTQVNNCLHAEAFRRADLRNFRRINKKSMKSKLSMKILGIGVVLAMLASLLVGLTAAPVSAATNQMVFTPLSLPSNIGNFLGGVSYIGLSGLPLPLPAPPHRQLSRTRIWMPLPHPRMAKPSTPLIKPTWPYMSPPMVVNHGAPQLVLTLHYGGNSNICRDENIPQVRQRWYSHSGYFTSSLGHQWRRHQRCPVATLCAYTYARGRGNFMF